MIVFDLQCHAGQHRFEGWFGSSDDFARQQELGLVCCPVCGSVDVVKAVQAPNVGRKGNQMPQVPMPQVPMPVSPSQPAAPAQVTNSGPALPPEAIKLFQAIATAQAEALKSSNYVGDAFADTARAIHYGEREPEPIHGEATAKDARELYEEGVEIAPVLIPIARPGETN
ncbi:MAG: DUF1178 family protein [Novosphingobium sp.]